VQWRHLPSTIVTWSLVTLRVTRCTMYSPGGISAYTTHSPDVQWLFINWHIQDRYVWLFMITVYQWIFVLAMGQPIKFPTYYTIQFVRNAYLFQYYGKSLEALPGVAYPGFRDNRSTLNTKTGFLKKTIIRYSLSEMPTSNNAACHCTWILSYGHLWRCCDVTQSFCC